MLNSQPLRKNLTALSTIQPLHSYELIKLLSDARRRAILKRLLAAPASLTQLGEALGEHPAWVRHHLKILENAGLVEMVEQRVSSGVVEKFYRACAGGYWLQEVILPDQATHPVVVLSGSHDLGLELLARQLKSYLDILFLPIGSLDGLIALRQGLSHLSGCHLLDASGEYNLPFVRHFFPDRPVAVFTFAYRHQGLMVAAGNPRHIHQLADLARDEVTFINRNPGSGTRLWLDRQLHALDIPPARVTGYGQTVATHTACAEAVQRGAADAALGLEAAALQHGLDFLPLFHERFDLVVPAEQLDSLHPLLDTLHTRDFRQRVENLGGYEMTHAGEYINL